MGKEKSSDTASFPQLVVLDKAFKLADQWVNKMTKITEDKSVEVEEESRPYRLGLGALVPRQTNIGHLVGVEKKLYSKLENSKRRNVEIMEETTTPSARDKKHENNKDDDDDDDDEEEGSRTSVFTKKRPVPATSVQQGKKKQKKQQQR
ncbi:uncharacterized protein LOC124915258 [Impatiens glandulifera]|uniref:uncharacterized protein LOC124915258 n=1 Tax=Impatiens glandulifera TaxID=253017 RepID=UPI001FB1515D|nr:uncharacterized protein LOC124915258 [Impatiens glandulifera]